MASSRSIAWIHGVDPSLPRDPCPSTHRALSTTTTLLTKSTHKKKRPRRQSNSKVDEENSPDGTKKTKHSFIPPWANKENLPSIEEAQKAFQPILEEHQSALGICLEKFKEGNLQLEDLLGQWECLDAKLAAWLIDFCGVPSERINLPTPTERARGIGIFNYAPDDCTKTQELMDNPETLDRIPGDNPCIFFATTTLPKFCLKNRKDLDEKELADLEAKTFPIDYIVVVCTKENHNETVAFLQERMGGQAVYDNLFLCRLELAALRIKCNNGGLDALVPAAAFGGNAKAFVIRMHPKEQSLFANLNFIVRDASESDQFRLCLFCHPQHWMMADSWGRKDFEDTAQTAQWDSNTVEFVRAVLNLDPDDRFELSDVTHTFGLRLARKNEREAKRRNMTPDECQQHLDDKEAERRLQLSMALKNSWQQVGPRDGSPLVYR